MPKAYEEYWLTFENNLERQGRDPVDIKTGILDWCFTEQSLQSWVECAQMAPGGLSLQARRHVKCLYTASVWASVWKRVCQEPHHHNRWTAAERLFHIALWEHTPPPPPKKKKNLMQFLFSLWMEKVLNERARLQNYSYPAVIINNLGGSGHNLLNYVLPSSKHGYTFGESENV